MKTNNNDQQTITMPLEGEVMANDGGGKRHPNFIESNTQEISLEELTERNIIPTFSDNSLTISHQNFISAVTRVASNVFGELTPVELRVSHPIIGRIPSAQHKKIYELTEKEKTVFYQRMTFCCHVVNLTKTINGQVVHLCIGGVRAYNEDKLYSRKSAMKFKVFVGWQVRVCSNLMLTCDGYSGTIECLTEADIMQKTFELFNCFEPIMDNTLHSLEDLRTTPISEELFCKIIGRMRLYQALPMNKQKELPQLIIGDSAVNAMVRNYVTNPDFGITSGGDFTFGTLCNSVMKRSNKAISTNGLRGTKTAPTLR